MKLKVCDMPQVAVIVLEGNAIGKEDSACNFHSTFAVAPSSMFVLIRKSKIS